jgi:hypothetical protein
MNATATITRAPKVPSPAQLLAQYKKLSREGESIAAASDRFEQISLIVDALALYQQIELLSDSIRIEPPSKEWYTPVWLLDLCRSVLGSFDLDPASNPIAQKNVQAKRFYTKDDDGLIQPWSGKVFINPPYGNLYMAFIQKAITLYQNGAIESAIFVLNRSDSSAYREVRDEFSGYCELRKRVRFLNPEGVEEKSPRYANDVLYIGPNPDLFGEVFSGLGDCRLNRNRAQLSLAPEIVPVEEFRLEVG